MLLVLNVYYNSVYFVMLFQTWLLCNIVYDCLAMQNYSQLGVRVKVRIEVRVRVRVRVGFDYG